MAIYKVLAVANNEDTRIELRRRFGREEEIALVGFASMNTDVLTKIKGYMPHVVLLVSEEGDTGVMEIAQRIYQSFPGIAIVLLTHSNDVEVLSQAMLSGIRRVVPVYESDTLKDVLIQAAVFEQARAVESGKEPKVIAFYGPRGGSGKTTLAVNLAVLLSKSGRRTALIDLSLCYGDVDLALNLKVKDTIAELVQEKNDFNIDDIKSFTVQHSSGLTVLCSPTSPKYAEYVTHRHVESIISVMRPYYDFVIVDLPSDLSDCTLSAIESADDIMLVARRDIPSLRASKSIMDILRSLQQQNKVSLIINADQKSVLSNSDFENVLEMPVLYSIPDDSKTAKLSQERGEPFVSIMPAASLTKGVMRLAKHCIKKDDKRKSK